jgi:hypothetical protein
MSLEVGITKDYHRVARGKTNPATGGAWNNNRQVFLGRGSEARKHRTCNLCSAPPKDKTYPRLSRRVPSHRHVYRSKPRDVDKRA